MDLADLVVERTAHDQPHHELDAFRARIAHVIDVRNARELVCLRRKTVEEAIVELLVDQARARPLELVAHAARAPDLHIQIRIKGLDGTTDRLAELVAALT